MKTLILVGALLLTPAVASAAAVNIVNYGTLSGGQLGTFDDIPGATASGTNYNNVMVTAGVGLGERFAGQTLGASGAFDTLTGAPTPGLTLLAGAANKNLDILVYNGSNVLTGLGNLGYPDFDAVGEGSFAVLFSTDQSQFGFQLVGGNGGDAFINFFRNDGSLISSLTVSGLADANYGFSREGGVHDIRGISITNNDLGGIGFDNLKFDVASAVVSGGVTAGGGDVAPGGGVGGVPETGVWTMLIMGFGMIGASLRARRRIRVA